MDVVEQFEQRGQNEHIFVLLAPPDCPIVLLAFAIATDQAPSVDRVPALRPATIDLAYSLADGSTTAERLLRKEETGRATGMAVFDRSHEVGQVQQCLVLVVAHDEPAQPVHAHLFVIAWTAVRHRRLFNRFQQGDQLFRGCASHVCLHLCRPLQGFWSDRFRASVCMLRLDGGVASCPEAC